LHRSNICGRISTRRHCAFLLKRFPSWTRSGEGVLSPADEAKMKAPMSAFSGVDYLLIDSMFSEQELLVRQTARQFVEDRLITVIRDCYREARFPKELIPEIGRLGF